MTEDEFKVLNWPSDDPDAITPERLLDAQRVVDAACDWADRVPYVVHPCDLALMAAVHAYRGARSA